MNFVAESLLTLSLYQSLFEKPFSKLKNPVPNTLAGYPAPKPPHNRKSEILQFFNFKEVDADAKNVRNYVFREWVRHITTFL